MVRRTLSRRKFLGTALTVLPASAAAHGFWLEPGWLVTRRFRLTSSASIHRIVHFTDLHYKGDRAYVERVVGRINELKPDLVGFTGDIIEDAEFLPEALKLLRQVQAPLYGIPGNHDFWAEIDFDAVVKAFAATGGQWLMDQNAIACGGQVNVIGVTCNKPPTVKPEPGVKNVLMFHYPAWVEKLSGCKFDLMLAGHSHGGQVRLPFFGSMLVPFGVGQFDMGLYQTRCGPLYVNPGIGYFFCNVRFCCRPEITVIEI